MSDGMSGNWGDPEEARKRKLQEYFKAEGIEGFYRVWAWAPKLQTWRCVTCPPTQEIAIRDREQLRRAGFCTAMDFLPILGIQKRTTVIDLKH